VFDTFLSNAETGALRTQESASMSAGQLKDVERHVEEIRSTGVHQIHGLLMAGVNAVSSPVFAMGNKLVGVVTVVGSASVFTGEHQANTAQKLLNTARAISVRMGGEMPKA
jgi:DNA-binding IclR family transcriptional regulator